MSNRNTILKQLAGDPALLSDLVDATGWPERKVRDTLGDLKKTGLAQFGRDDVTGKPMYSITKAGKAWLMDKSNSVKTPAGGGESITPAAEEATTSLAACSTVAVPAVVETPTLAEAPAAAVSDEKAATFYALAFSGDLFDSAEEVVARALDTYNADTLKQAVVVSVRMVGRIALRPVLVPMEEAA